MGPERLTRPEYVRMGQDFERLASAFGVRLDLAAHADVRLLASCIEPIDQAIDDTLDASERQQASWAIIDGLRSSGPLDGPLGLGRTLEQLREMLVRRDITERFCLLAEQTLENTERVRRCTSRDELVARVVHEGRLTASMALLVAGLGRDGAFARFLLAVSEPANLVDKLVDARADARRGEIALAADARLHARLAVEIVRRLPALVGLHPRPAQMLAWGASSTLALALGR
jgi:hypothetical protein